MKQQPALQVRGPERIIGQMIRWAAALVFSIVIILLLTYSHVSYVAKTGFATKNLSKLLVALLAAAGIMLYAIRYPARKSALSSRQKMRLISCALLFVQLYLLRNTYFLTDWDPKVVNDIVKMLLEDGEIIGWYQSYVSTYPNNLMLIILEAFFLRLNQLFGIFTGSYELVTMCILNCLFANFACYQTYFIIYEKTQSKRGAMLGYVICVALVGISPWMVIPYTDTLGLLFPVLVLRIYSKEARTQWHLCLKWGAIAALSAVGYYFKPQCLIIFIAIFLIQVFRHISKRHILRLVALLMAFICAFLAINAALDMIAGNMNISRNSECKLGWQHFLMMGLNYERNGVYSSEDVQFSTSIATSAERNAQNLAVVKERISELNWKLLDHWAKKLLCLFNDGMFSWGMEGSFYYELLDEPNKIAAPFLRSMFYSYGNLYKAYASIIHTIWIGVLLLILVGCIFGKKDTKQTSVIRLSLLGLVLFELLFEVRARYLFTYVPLCVILAVQGLHSAKNRLEKFIGANVEKA